MLDVSPPGSTTQLGPWSLPEPGVFSLHISWDAALSSFRGQGTVWSLEGETNGKAQEAEGNHYPVR